MVRIEYVDGTEDTVETVQNEFYRDRYFVFDNDLAMFIVLDHEKTEHCMMIPREFVKRIRHIDTE